MTTVMQDILGTTFGTVILYLMSAMGWVVLLGGVYKTYQSFNAPPQQGGGAAKAVRTFILTIIIAAVLFIPSLLGSLINLGGTVVNNSIIPTVQQISSATTVAPVSATTTTCAPGAANTGSVC